MASAAADGACLGIGELSNVARERFEVRPRQNWSGSDGDHFAGPASAQFCLTTFVKHTFVKQPFHRIDIMTYPIALQSEE